MSQRDHPLVKRLNEIIEERSLLKHPYYQAWQAGELTLDDLREYATQYYSFESAFPRFLSAIHLRCPIHEIRQDILQNLWDEEHGPDNHRKLWLDFCEKLGLNRVEIERTADNAHTHKYSSDYPVLQRTHDLVVTYTRLANVMNYQDGLAALYAYESQIPSIARVKMQSLREHYQITDPAALQFFTVHQTQDIEHAESEARGIAMFISQFECERIENSAREALEAWWNFLDELNKSRERRNKDNFYWKYFE